MREWLKGAGCTGALAVGHSLLWGGVFLKLKVFQSQKVYIGYGCWCFASQTLAQELNSMENFWKVFMVQVEMLQLCVL